MSNSEVFGSPMILTGNKPVSPFGAAPYAPRRDAIPARAIRRLGGFLGTLLRRAFVPNDQTRRIRKTAVALSRLDDRTLRDIGLNRASIISSACQAELQRSPRSGRQPF
ncbi:DUF1127 domain-containing protein [Pelagibius marinus]|uniref:DUF1127 domain-containing protein n=1 Tax=Pelagibius marinus TaxID=2762760 RepID=UPI001872F906|nr:DUF1127 domain-containing protein [Pelagibius marinus]